MVLFSFVLLQAGQPSGLCIGVANGGGNQQQAFTVDRPFTHPLDATSHITILPFQGTIAFNGNDYSDGGEVQFYSTALGVQAIGNRFSRTGGLTSWAYEQRTARPSGCNNTPPLKEPLPLKMAGSRLLTRVAETRSAHVCGIFAWLMTASSFEIAVVPLAAAVVVAVVAVVVAAALTSAASPGRHGFGT